jgi:hypothetical protein
MKYEDLGVDVTILLEWILGVKVGTGFFWMRIRTSGGLFGHGNELSGSIKGGEFLH